MMGDVEAAISYVQSAEASLSKDATPENCGKLMSLQACIALSRDAAGIQLAKEALKLLEDAGTFFRGLTLLVLGEGQILLGDTGGAIHTFQEALRIGRRSNDQFMIVGAAVNLAQQLNWQGKRREAIALCQNAIDHCVDVRGQPLPFAWLAYITLGEMAYWGNHLTEAQQYIQKGIALGEQQGILGFLIASKLTLAPLQRAMGDTQTALATIQEVYQITAEGNFESYLGIVAALEADYQLRLGNIASVEYWAAGLEKPESDSLTPFGELEYLTYARFLLVQNRAQEAQQLLAKIEDSARTGERYLMLIMATILQALAQMALGNEPKALARLEDSLHLAEPELYYRPFLNEDSRLIRLLIKVRHASPNFVDSLLDAFKLQDTEALVLNEEGPMSLEMSNPFSDGNVAPQPLIEPLSDREVEVLQLVTAGHSNREIAETIFVTVGTVKKHLSNIFGKLDVNSRTQAVARARDLGLVQ